MPATAIAGFDEHFMRKLEYLALVAKRFSGQFKAERRTKKLGSGLEFADYRGYVPGDDGYQVRKLRTRWVHFRRQNLHQ